MYCARVILCVQLVPVMAQPALAEDTLVTDENGTTETYDMDLAIITSSNNYGVRPVEVQYSNPGV